MNFTEWFETFLDEKGLGYQFYEVQDNEGTTHFIDSETVIDLIKRAPAHEQEQIKHQIVKIDFHNGDIHDFFKFLAGAFVNLQLQK